MGTSKAAWAELTLSDILMTNNITPDYSLDTWMEDYEEYGRDGRQ